MRWPFQRRQEVRQQDATEAALTASAGAVATLASHQAAATAAAVSGIRVLSDMFAVATVTPRRVADLLTADVRADLVRRLLVRGNAVYDIDVDDDGRIALVPAATWDVTGGGVHPDSWRYELDLARPYLANRVRRMGAGLVHCRIGQGPASPWRGRSPLLEAGLTSETLANIELSLQREGVARQAHVLALPDASEGGQFSNVIANIRAANGKLVLAETMRSGLGQGAAAAPKRDYETVRLGPQVPAESIALRESAGRSVLHALGIPDGTFFGDGVAMREGHRLLTVRTAPALGEIIAAELEAKLEIAGVSFAFGESGGQDLAQRARAVQTLVAAGMPLTEALAKAGV